MGKKNVFNIVRPYKGKTLASVGNYIVIGRDEFLKLFPEFKGEYSYKPLYRFTLIKDGNGYRPVRRTGKEGDEFDRLYTQKYAGTEAAVTVKERDTIKDIKENQDYYRYKAELRGELNQADTIENRIKLEDLSELGIKILNDRDLARALKKKADENVSKLLSLGIVDAAQDFVRNRLYKNLHPYSYGDPVGRGINAVILDLNDRDLETLYNPSLNVTSPEVLRDLVYAEWAKIPELDRYTLNSPEISDSEGVDMVENPSYIDYNLEEIPLKLKDHSVNFHFPLGSKLYPLYSAKDFSVVDYSLRYMRPGLNISGITTGTPKKVAGEYTIGRGYEPGKGSYMSYYDKWDILPTGKGSDFDWITPLIDPGNINLYDRIYYDDVYFNPKEQNLGYRYMIAPLKDSPYYSDHVRMKLMLNETPSEDAVLGTYWLPGILVLPDGLKDTESFSIKGDGANVSFKYGGLMNSTWDTLDMTTKAKVMKEALLKGITDIDIIKRNYDSKYLNVNMLPQVEDNFSKEQLYDLYNKVEGSNRSNNMYPSNSYGNLFVNGGKKDGDDWHEGVYLTNFGARNSYRKTTKYPLFITLTEEEYKDLKEKNMHVTFDYSKVKKDLRPIDNATTLLAVPGSFILKLHPDMQDEGSVVYFLDHTTGPDADGNYIINKLDLNTALGKLYIKWKEEQELYRKMASNPNPLGITEEEGQTEYIPLEELVVTKNLNTGELYNNYSLLTLDSNTKTSNTEPIPLIANLNYTNNKGTSEKRYIDPLGSTGTKEVLSKGESNSNGVVNGSPFGELGGIEMPARSFPEDSSMGFYYPGGYGGNYGYYGYQPSNILINWPTDYNLPDYSGEYDASHNGVPVEKLPFIENDKLNLNDLLAWILTLLNNKGYPVDGESEFTLPKRSKLITPKHTDVLLTESHVFNNKKAMGGRINKFETGGNTTLIEENVYSPFTINGITYGIIPNLIADTSKGQSDLEGNDVVGKPPVYVKYNPLKKKWENTTMARDANNIRMYENRPKESGTILAISEDGKTLYGTLPDLIVGSIDNKDSLPATYDEKAKSAGAYDPYNNPSISAQLNNLFNSDPVIKELRRRIFDSHLKLYNASDFLNTIIPMHLISPTNYVGAIGEAARGNANFFLNALSGRNRGLFSLSDDLYNWSTEHPYISAGINMVGDMALGAAAAKPFMDWRNPNSLWSRNIRTDFANNKVPFSYVLKDKENILPYFRGTWATIIGKEIPLQNRLLKVIDRANSVFYKNAPKVLPNETYAEYLKRTGLQHSTHVEQLYNRQGMWNHYLGVGDQDYNLNMSINGRSENYIKQPDGTYDINLTPDEEAEFLLTAGVSKVKDNHRYLTYDYVIGNHGNVGAQIAYDNNGNLVSVIEDPFDLHPVGHIKEDIIKNISKKLQKGKTRTIAEKVLQKIIPNPEVSEVLPKGTNILTLKHTIPIDKNFIGYIWDDSPIINPNATIDLKTLEDVEKVINNGTFLYKNQ